MKNIVYKTPEDLKSFDLAKFVASLNKYAKVSEDEAKEALADFQHYDTLHVSCLVEAGTQLIADKAGKDAAKQYFNDHASKLDENRFERLRRITGYLVGTLDRWNDAKKAEEHARVKHSVGTNVKHSVNSAVDDATRLVMLETQAMEQNIAYAR